MSSINVSGVSMFALVSSHTASGSQNTRVSWAGDMNPATNKPRTVSVTVPGHHEGMPAVLLRLMGMPGAAVLRVSGLKSVEGGFTLSAAAPLSPNSLIDLLLAVAVRQGNPLVDPRPTQGKDGQGKPEGESKGKGKGKGRQTALPTVEPVVEPAPDHNANGAPVPA